MCSTFDACQTNNNYIERYRVSQKYLGMLKGFLKSIKMEGINKRVRGGQNRNGRWVIERCRRLIIIG